MIISVRDENAQRFFILYMLGITSALQKESITFNEAWNWGLHIGTMDYVEKRYGEGNLEQIVHLGTELGDVKRIIPHAFSSSCENIIELCHETLLANNITVHDNDFYLTIE